MEEQKHKEHGHHHSHHQSKGQCCCCQWPAFNTKEFWFKVVKIILVLVILFGVFSLGVNVGVRMVNFCDNGYGIYKHSKGERFNNTMRCPHQMRNMPSNIIINPNDSLNLRDQQIQNLRGIELPNIQGNTSLWL